MKSGCHLEGFSGIKLCNFLFYWSAELWRHRPGQWPPMAVVEWRDITWSNRRLAPCLGPYEIWSSPCGLMTSSIYFSFSSPRPRVPSCLVKFYIDKIWNILIFYTYFVSTFITRNLNRTNHDLLHVKSRQCYFARKLLSFFHCCLAYMLCWK